MTAEELLTFKGQGEASKVQFKERILDKYDIGCELVASSNTHVVGIQRALENDLKISFANNERLHEFLITIGRNGNQVGMKSNQVKEKSNQVYAFPEEPSNQVARESNQVYKSTPRRAKLTAKQKDIVNFCNIPRSANEIMERLGITNQSKNRAKYIAILVDMGYLEMTNPNNPNASNQKYRKKQQNNQD